MSEAPYHTGITDDQLRAINARATQVVDNDTELAALRDERDRLRKALEVAGDDICSEFCGAGPCHKKCLAVKAALTPAGGGQGNGC